MRRPGAFSSLKYLSCAHGRADCDCATDRLWKITSDVFMGFWRDSLSPGKSAASSTNAPQQTGVIRT